MCNYRDDDDDDDDNAAGDAFDCIGRFDVNCDSRDRGHIVPARKLHPIGMHDCSHLVNYRGHEG